MALKPERFKLQIPNQINDYKSFIDYCCDFIGDVSDVSKNFAETAKFKLVIMELLTNAMKHSSTCSFIEIEKLTNQLSIRKIDEGNRFSFKDLHTDNKHEFPLDILPGTKVTALLGNNYKLTLLIKDKHLIEFIAPEEIEYKSFADIPEHFGLMIIAQCCDVFHYQFNEKNNQNVFEVIFKY
ncbi:MAG: hypothetical protein ABIP95_00220 [Pelobium sp.]